MVPFFTFIFAIRWLFWLRLGGNTFPAKTDCDGFGPRPISCFFSRHITDIVTEICECGDPSDVRNGYVILRISN